MDTSGSAVISSRLNLHDRSGASPFSTVTPLRLGEGADTASTRDADLITPQNRRRPQAFPTEAPLPPPQQQQRHDDVGPLLAELDETRRHCAFLTDIVARLNSALAKYHGKTNVPPSMMVAGSVDGAETGADGQKMPPWWTDERAMCPLLTEYDQQLADKDAAIGGLETELDAMRRRVEALLVENEAAIVTMRSRMRTSDGDRDREGDESMRRHVVILEEENRILNEQTSSLQTELDGVQSALEVASRDAMRWRSRAEDAERKAARLNAAAEKNGESLRMSEDLRARENAEAQAISNALAQASNKFDEDRRIAQTTIDALRIDIADATRTLSVLDAEATGLRNELAGVRGRMGKMQRKIDASRDAAAAAFARESVAIRQSEHLSRKARQLRAQRDSALRSLRELEVSTVRLAERIESQKAVTTSSVESAIRMCAVGEGEKSRLLDALKSLEVTAKEQRGDIERLLGDKRSIEGDLDKLWRSTNMENRQMIDSLGPRAVWRIDN